MAATEAGSPLPMSLSLYHLLPPGELPPLQLGHILLGLNFESASCCRMRV